MYDPYYVKKVLNDYEQKKRDNKLSLALMNPTPAGLKEECKNVVRERFIRKSDAFALKGFFGVDDNVGGILDGIEIKQISKFKPLVKYLKKESNTTNGRNIELLALLIDFQPRPWQYGVDYSKVEIMAGAAVTAEEDQQLNDVDLSDVEPANEFDETDDDSVIEELEVEDETGPITREPLDEKQKSKETDSGIENDIIKDDSIVMEEDRKEKEITSLEIVVSMLAKVPQWMSVAVLLILLSSGTLLYMQVNNGKYSNIMGVSLNNNETSGWMYWDGEEYKQINYIPMPDTIVTRLDVNKLKGFKKITNPDTLDINDVGSVWYTKITKDSLEYYTGYGNHPVWYNKRLKPLSKYIVDTHILKSKKKY